MVRTVPATPEAYRAWWARNYPSIPYGTCACGCMEPTSIAKRTNKREGCVRGEPRRFIQGHHLRYYFRKPNRISVEDRGYDTPCWIWQLKISDNGYGHVTIGGRDRLAHRVAYESEHDEIPTGLSIDHLCSQRACVNPAHLEAVPMHINQRRGSHTLLNEELVMALKEGRELGAEYELLETLTGIKKRTIIAAVKGENWAK